MKQKIFFILIAVFGSLGLCSPPAFCAEAQPLPAVSFITLSRETVDFSRTFVGYIEGERFVEVRAQVSGILKARLYEEGARVQAGQVLFEIDPAPYQAVRAQAESRLENARARLTSAERNLVRATPLAQRNSISPREFDMVRAEHDGARASLREAEAALRAAQLQLDLTRVTAPVSGYATAANLSEGSLVNASSPDDSLLTSINYMDTVNVVFSVPSALVRRIEGYMLRYGAELHRNAEATMELDKGLAYPHKGRMEYGNAVVSRVTGGMMARAVFPNPEYTLFSGQIVRIVITILSFPEAISIPQHAVLQTGNGPVAVVLNEDDTIEFRPISVLAGIRSNEFLVTDGLETEERVVVEGIGKVGPGSRVHPAPYLSRPSRDGVPAKR